INAIGNALANTLIGNDGNNVIAGGLGIDDLTGEGGADRFIFNGVLGSSNADKVEDFHHGEDVLVLSPDVFHALGPAGHELDDSQFLSGSGVPTPTNHSEHILYSTDTGSLYYDPDGSGAAAAVQFAALAGTPSVDQHDFVIAKA
ncbi:MAG: hypothetical protein C5B46_02290, partial [Proteobacteria bacterium]